MTNYKNQLTHKIITTAFEKYSSTRKQINIQLQMLYKTLCQMVSDNSKSRKDRVFDRDLFEQIMEESVLVKDNNRVMVEMSSFMINLMRTQILINQSLKTLHLQITKIINQLSNNIHQHSNNDRNRKARIIRLEEIRQEKEQSQNNLFCIRLTFIKEQDLKLLTKKQLEIDSQLSYLIEKVLRRVTINHKQQQNNQQHIKAANNQSKTSYYLKQIFILTLTLIILQSVSIIFYSNFTLSILLFGMIMSIYIKRKYNKIYLKVLLLLSLISIVMDLGFFYVHFQDILNHNISNMIEKPAIMMINEFCSGYFVTGLTGVIFLTLFGKILLSILIFMQFIEKIPTNTNQLILFGHQIQIRFIPTLQQDTISQSLAKFLY